jgi:pimeloyl-ACP methyl ester carboxylesterase
VDDFRIITEAQLDLLEAQLDVNQIVTIAAGPYGVPAQPSWKDFNWATHQRFKIINGTKVAFIDIGQDGTPCILLHGIGTSWHTWLETIPTLAMHRRVVAVDLPGFGSSERPSRQPCAEEAVEYIHVLCDTLGFDRVDVCGHSLGGLLALQLAYCHPERVRTLVLASAALKSITEFYQRPRHGLWSSPGVCARFVSAVIGLALPLPQAVLGRIVNSRLLRHITFTGYIYEPNAINHTLLLKVLSGVGRWSTISTAMKGFSYKFDTVTNKIASDGAPPVLIIHGWEDSLAPPADVPSFHRHIPHARVVMLEKTGHFPMIERSEVFNRLLLAWL